MGELKARLVGRIKAYLGDDSRRVRHALRVTEHAERILSYEKSADRDVVISAAILHDIGIHEAERKHGSSAGRHQEVEGPPIARRFMLEECLPTSLIEEVCQIIGHHHTPGVIDTINFRVVYDSDLIVNLGDRELPGGRLLTQGGRKVADYQPLLDP